MPCFRIFCVRIIINVTFSELFYNTFFHFWNRLTHLLSYFLTMLFSFVCFWPDMINYFFRGGPGGLIKDYSNYNHSYRFIYRRDFFSSTITKLTKIQQPNHINHINTDVWGLLQLIDDRYLYRYRASGYQNSASLLNI